MFDKGDSGLECFNRVFISSWSLAIQFTSIDIFLNLTVYFKHLIMYKKWSHTITVASINDLFIAYKFSLLVPGTNICHSILWTLTIFVVVPKRQKPTITSHLHSRNTRYKDTTTKANNHISPSLKEYKI
jgi:hypothetical protein